MIKFSIITVCLNAGQDLIDTVNSTLEQTYGDYEIIVKDGFSTDGSVEKLPEDDRIRVIQQNDAGIYDAMNQGIDAAIGDYLLFMNAGDRFYDNSTLSEVESLIDVNSAVMYYGRCYNDAINVYSNSPKHLTPFFCYRSMICHQAMIFQRKYIQRNKYDCGYDVSADREMLLDIVVKKKLDTKYIPIIVARYKGDGFCETEKNKQKVKEEDKRLKEVFFTNKQRMLYGIMISLTFPKIRQKIVNNPKLRRTYKVAVGMLYGNRGVNHGK